MRKVVFGGANSLDNYFARKDHSTDWLRWSNEAAEVTSAYWKTFDTVSWAGRRTRSPCDTARVRRRIPASSRTCSRARVPNDADGAVTIVATDAVEFVRQLKGKRGQDICLMGGGELARSFFEAGLIDEVGFNIHPVLLGSGIPLFHEMTRQIDLELLECRPFKNGCVLVKYRVKH